MIKFIGVSLFLLAVPVLAANVKSPQCKDLSGISDKYTPEYLAVVDGYNKAGEKIGTEVDMGGIVTESDGIKTECQKNANQKIDTVQKNMAPTATGNVNTPKTTGTFNPKNAKCEDFVALGEDIQPVATFWVAGHSKSGKIKNGQVDEEFLARPVVSLIEECKAQPKASFYSKAKAWLKKHT
jgi:hypothetical protein